MTGDIDLPDVAPTTYVSRKGRRKARRLRTVALVSICALLLLVGFQAAAALMGPSMVRVPDLVGTHVPKAVKKLETVGLGLEISERERRAGTEAGEVLSQTPERGEVEEGQKVSVVVSAGPPLSKVPDLVGISLDSARVRINAAELEIGELSVEFSVEEKGTVVEQRPSTGKREWGSAIDLVVSRGPRQIQVPDVTGMEESKAIARLKEAGFKASVSEVYSGKVRRGSVVATTPSGGLTAADGSTIELQVSIGPEFQKVRVPDVRGLSIDQAEVKLSSLGLRWNIERSCEGGTTVVETHPTPGTVVRENSVVALFIC